MTRRVVVFVRPWEEVVLPRLIIDLRRGALKGVPVTWVSAWADGTRRLAEFCELPDDEAVDLTERLMSVPPPTGADEAWLSALEEPVGTALGASLSTVLQNDRFRPDDPEKARQFLYRHARALDGLIGKDTMVVSGCIDHITYWLACGMARAQGGHYFGFLATSRPSGRTMVISSAHTLWMPREATAESTEEAQKQISDIRTGKKPDYMRRPAGTLTVAQRMTNRAETVREVRRGNYLAQTFLIPRPLFAHQKLLWPLARRQMAARRLDDQQRPFVYFPMHLDPEATTLVFSPWSVDQAHVVEVLRRALPPDVDLVVKENPKMWGVRPGAFYKRIRQAHGIWIEPTTPSEALIERAAAIITLTGTTGIEALLLGKPVALLGKPPWADALASAHVLKLDESLPEGLRDLLAGRLIPDQALFEAEYSRFVANMIPGRFLSLDLIDGQRIIPYRTEFAEFVTDALATL